MNILCTFTDGTEAPIGTFITGKRNKIIELLITEITINYVADK